VTRTLKSFAKAMVSRWLRLRRPTGAFPGVVVCCYHGIRPDDVPVTALPFGQLHVTASELDTHCAIFRGWCDPISLDDLLRARSRRDLPARPVLVSFDDIYASVLRLGSAIVERHRITPALFVCDGPSRERRAFWFDCLARSDGEEAVARVKAGRFEEWQRVARTAPALAEDDYAVPARIDEISEAARSGQYSVGGHTRWHPVLARLPVAEQSAEIIANRDGLAAITGSEVRSFAYPNGRAGEDFTPETTAAVQRAGYDCAFTTDSGYADPAPAGNRFQWPRFVMLAGLSGEELLYRLFYRWPRSHGG
jgi:peptidoglycan/xylan/chitin deacetylase (PgdA/CDA1 family)